MVEQNGSARLHPDDLQTIVKALQRGLFHEPHLDRPPAYATGRDAAIFKDVAVQVVREVVPPLIKEAVEDTLARAGLRVDKEHIDETRRSLDDLLRVREAAGGVWKEVLKSSAGWIGMGVLALWAYATSYNGPKH